MNGATEATLIELLRVAERQNINLERLNALASKSGGLGGGGGGGSAISAVAGVIPGVSAAFSVLSGAASMVGSAFEMVGSIIGKLVSGITDTIGNLFKFSLQAMDGTAKLSDLYNAFRDLPFGLGLVAQGFSTLLKFVEKTAEQYKSLSNSGSGFAGNLTELKISAAQLNMSLDQYSKLIKDNSLTLAGFGDSVDSGVRRFSRAMLPFGPGGAFSQNINSLGMTTADAGEYMITMMKIQQGLVKGEQVDSSTLSKMTNNYIMELDAMSKATGMHRDQLNAEIKKIADDQGFMTMLDGLTEKQRAAATQIIASSAFLGKDVQDLVKSMIQNVDFTDATNKVASFTDGALTQLGPVIRELVNSGKEVPEIAAIIGQKFGDVAQAYLKTTQGIGTEVTSILSKELNQPLLQHGRNIAQAGSYTAYQMKAEKERLKAYNSEAEKLQRSQATIAKLGNVMTEMYARIVAAFLPLLTEYGTRFTLWVSSIVETYGPNLVKWFQKSTEIFDTYILPRLEAIGRWFLTTWNDLAATSSVNEFFKVLGKRLVIGWDEIIKGIKTVWASVEPEFTKVWNKDLKPALLAAFNTVADFIIDSLRNSWFGRLMTIGVTTSKDEKRELVELRNNKDQNKKNSEDVSWFDTITTLGIANIRQAIALLEEQRRIELESKYAPKPNPTPRASGGSINPGTYLVGEKGPELLSVGSNGSVITNENLQQLLSRMADNTDSKNLVTMLEALNNNMKQLNLHARETAEYTRRTVSELSGLNTNSLPTI